MTTYSITRMFQDGTLSSQLIRTGLTLKQAQAHCSNPETSSSTATSPAARERTERFGPWFDGYDAEQQQESVRHECCNAVWWTHSARRQACELCGELA